ncbi:AI-2E family transporter [Mucilaginibacter daejeonensis]|uniref:AI-2E family transporter n=1 Tax=Mucilaginibacter daejeonensis TaxID=398049 RepID=UPI001D1735EF|nr:AI-2E family transporter [Mucilaginibacter daejeonensis]UEG54467.1 AI-2E family transporter [Mucilaginibacter daejeonensis]
MQKEKQYPFYLQATVVLFGLILSVYVLNSLADILIPLAFAAFIAVLLNRLCNRLMKARIPQIPAIIISMLLAVIVVAGIFYFLSSQIVSFGDTLPTLKAKFAHITNDLKIWIYQHFGIDTQKQVKFINDALNSSKALVGRTINTVLGTLSIIFLIPVYVFLMLLYKTLIVNFLFEVFSEEKTAQVAEILQETKAAIQSYIIGLLTETLVVAIMNSVALLLLGVPYAILIGVIGALLNLIPYIGGLVAIALPILMATVTHDGYGTQLGVVAAYLFIQFIDNNILVPRIVSSKVQINALISIVVVLLGNALWGVSGMFLSIPFIAVLKIVFDRIDELKPWGKLLGDNIPTHSISYMWQKRNKKAVTKEGVVKNDDEVPPKDKME